MLSRRKFTGSGLALAAVGGRLLAHTPGAARLVRLGFRGPILTPDSADYRTARRMFVTTPRKPGIPALIAQCENDDDVRRALEFARRSGLPFAVRAGGHDLLASSTTSGIVIDLSLLQTIQIDAAANTVRVGAGVRAGNLNAALAAQGRAAVLGCAGQVGVAGLTLGGGLGWLVGKYGAACDHLVAARLITADGRVLHVDAQQHPDLLWALRGGGGNFGIVTELTLNTQPAPAVTSGIVVLRGDDIARFLPRLYAFLAESGDDLDIEPFAFPAPETPAIFIKACYSGAPAGAEKALAPLRSLAPFVADDLAPRPYTGLIDPTGSVAPLFRAATPARRPDDVPGLYVGAVSMAPVEEEAAGIIGDQLRRGQGNWAAGFAHYIHGAATRIGPDHSPMPRLQGLLTTYVLTSWRRPEQADPAMRWVDDSMARLLPYAKPTYLNYLTDEQPVAVRAAYGRSFGRLAQIKRRYDPDNIFRQGRNIRPA